MNKWIRLLPGYLWQSRWQILFFTVLCAVLGLVYSLYQLPWGPALYTLLLFFTAAFLSLLLGFHRHVRRLEQLEVLKKQASYHLGALPEPTDPEERAYQQVLLRLEDRCRRTEADTEKGWQRRSDITPSGPIRPKRPWPPFACCCRNSPWTAPL